MTWIVWTFMIVFALSVILSGDKIRLRKREVEGIKRTGRVGLWLMLPPAGLWRSWKHGQRKRDERLARMIREGNDGQD